MIIQCPKCGEKVTVNGLGRKPLNIPLKNICECLRRHCSVAAAAEELGCSKAYIFKALKDNGLRLKDVIKNRKTGGGSLQGFHKIRLKHGMTRRYQT